jgi:hypothetical protein
MNRSVSVLLVLLAASLIANAVLLVRLSRREEGLPSSPKSVDRAAAVNGRDATPLRESLEQEQAKSRELRTRIERLEADKKLLAEEVPVPKQDKLAEFREKIRRYRKQMNTEQTADLNNEAMIEMSETSIEMMKLAAARSKDPARFGAYMQVLMEVCLEGDRTSLSAAESAAMGKLFQDMGEEIKRLPSTPAAERMIREIEIEAASMARMQGMLNPQQKELLPMSPFGMSQSTSSYNSMFVQKKDGVETIVGSWMQTYGLDEGQRIQLTAAAKSYLDGIERLEKESGVSGSSAYGNQGDAGAYAFRIRSLRDQLAALKSLEGSMNAEQRERLAARTPREFYLYTDQGLQIDVIQKSSDK